MPLVPPGTRGITYKSPQIHNTWAPCGNEDWCIGPALEHYRCATVYFPHTQATRTVNTVCYFPRTIHFPKATLEDHLKQASTDIVDILENIPSTVTPELQSGNKIHNTILELVCIY